MLKEKLVNIMYNQRCISCKGFVFLVNFEVVGRESISGMIVCPECKTNEDCVFYLNTKSTNHN